MECVQVRNGDVIMLMEDALLVVLLLSMFLNLSHVKLMDVLNTLWVDVNHVTKHILSCIIHVNFLTVSSPIMANAYNVTQTMFSDQMVYVYQKTNFVKRWMNTVLV